MKPAAIILGSNTFTGCDAPLLVRGEPLVRFDVDGDHLQVDLHVPSPPASVPLVIKQNVVVQGPAVVQVLGSSVRITNGAATVLFADANGGVVQVLAFDLTSLGIFILGLPIGLRIGGAMVSGNEFHGGGIALG